MNVLGAQRTAVYLTAGAGLASVVASDQLQTPFAYGLPAAVGVSYFLGERYAGKLRIAWQIGLVALLAYFVFAVGFVGSLDIVIASSTFAATLLVYALFNRATVRDYNLVHLAALMCIAGGAALSAELAYGVCFLVFAVAGTWSLTFTQLRVEIEEEARLNKVPDGGASVLRSQHLISSRLMAVLAGLALAALTVAASVFILFPRLSLNLLHGRLPQPQAHTGFAGSVELGGHGLIKNDPTVALRIQVGAHKRGESLDLYWRGAAFDQYDGSRWNNTDNEARTLKTWNDAYYADHHAGGDEYDIEVAPEIGTNTIFSTGRWSSVQFVRPPSAPRFTRSVSLLEDGLGGLKYMQTGTPEIRYLLVAQPEPVVSLRGLGHDYAAVVNDPRERHGSHAGRLRDTPAFVHQFTQLPQLDAEVAALGHRLTDGRDPYDAAMSVQRYLQSYTYSTNLPEVGADPLHDFLFKTKIGHCEYFATAMAILLRVGGIPTRLVTGYYGGRYVDRGDYYAVREGDAHAWTEVYFPERGWVTFDSTPPTAREAELQNLYGKFELWLDGVRTAWRDLVVEYDFSAQYRGLRRIGDLLSQASRRLATTPKTIRLAGTGKVLVRAAGLLALLILAVVAWRRLRRSGRAAPQSETHRRARALYERLLTRLARHGVVRSASQTPREVVEAARATEFERVDLVERVVERYMASRYGTAPLDRAELRSLERELRQL